MKGMDMGSETTPVATRWIVGVDGSPDAQTALQWAARTAEGRGERVTPLSAWHLPLPLAALAARRGFDVDRMGLEAEAGVGADETIRAIDTCGVVDEPLVIEGQPGPLLLERSGPDTVVVVGRRGIGGLERRLLGSVSQYIATHADGPVVVVPAGWERRTSRKIVVGYDGSAHAGEALRWALDIADADSEVVALIAIEVAPWLSPQDTLEQHGELVETARRRITSAADIIDPEQRAVRSIAVQGARRAFEDVLDDADLLVVGPRGLGGLARAMLGSLTTWLLSTAPCPVAVIPSTGVDTEVAS